MKRVVLMLLISTSITTLLAQEIDSIIDVRDGQVYKIVKIGEQWWMAENLNFFTSDGSWYYNNDSVYYVKTYGRLYNWETSNNICPLDWHLPSENEWQKLINYVSNDGHSGYEGIALKAVNEWSWAMGSKKGTDNYGFSVMPGGYRDNYGNYIDAYYAAGFWSATEYSNEKAWTRRFYYCNVDVQSGFYYKNYSFSVRCTKDTIDLNQRDSLPIITTQPVSQTKKVGESVTFTVEAEGTGLSYQWQKSGEILTEQENFSGINSNHLQISDLKLNDAGIYSCLVISENETVESNKVNLNVLNLGIYGGIYYENDFYDYLQPIPQDKIAILFHLQVSDNVLPMHDIKIEANIGSIPLNPVMDDRIDKDFDNDIDVIPSISFPDLNYIQLLVVSDPLEENIENEALTLTVITDEGDVQVEEQVSFYFAKSQESSHPFDVEKDAYSFKNLSWLTLNEIKGELSKYGIIGVATIIYKEAKTWAGRCFGMAGTEGLYFIKPGETPYPSIDVFDLDSSDAKVTDHITEFHLSQNLMTINSILDDPVMENEFFILKSNLERNLPVMIGMEAFNTDNQPIGRHAVLVTNMIVFEGRNQITFTIIDSNYPTFALNGSYDNDNESFSYSSYSTFVSIPIVTVPYNVPESIINFYSDLWNSIVNPIGEAFKLFTLFADTDESKFKTQQSIGYSFIFTNEQGERYGIDVNGTFINEITEGRMEAITTSNMSNDSIYYIYLPANNNYNLEIKGFSDCNFNLEYYVPIDEGEGELIIGAADSINFNETTIATFSELDTTGQMLVDLNDDGIIDQYVPIIEMMTGKKEFQTNKHIRNINVIPNPFNDITIVQFPNPEQNKYQLYITDLSGKTVKAIANITNEMIEVNRDDLQSGLYLIELRGPQIYKGKIVIE